MNMTEDELIELLTGEKKEHSMTQDELIEKLISANNKSTNNRELADTVRSLFAEYDQKQPTDNMIVVTCNTVQCCWGNQKELCSRNPAECDFVLKYLSVMRMKKL